MTVDATLKGLKIQTGIVQRLNNEIRYYSKEVASLQGKYEALKSQQSEQTKQAYECWLDAQKVLPQVQLQLKQAHKELIQIMEKDFDAVEVVPTSEPVTDAVVAAVLQARTQLQRTLEIVKDAGELSSKASKAVEVEEQEY